MVRLCSLHLLSATLTLLLIFNFSALRGNDCSSAVSLTIHNPATTAFACTTPSNQTFAGTCALLYNHSPGGVCTSQATCSQDLWFQLDPNNPTDQVDIDLELSFDFSLSTASEVRYYLLYSESKDSGNGDPCTWTNTASQDFTRRFSGCENVPAGVFQTTLSATGLDGTATYFLVLERVTGTGGSVSICAQQIGTSPAPSNDRANNPTVLSLGNGIDANVAVGGSGSWSDAISGTTQYATKQRMQNECLPALPTNHTEDHFYKNDLPFGCITDGTIGDVFLNPTSTIRIDRAIKPNEGLDNTVFFQFTPPLTTPTNDWYLHIGNMNCPGLEVDSLTVMISDNFDPQYAINTSLLLDNTSNPAYQHMGAQNNPPSSDGTIGPLTLSSASTYYIIVDGVNGAGCDFNMILTRSLINPVLPVEYALFEGYNEDRTNHLKWEIAGEDDHSHFVVERSVDGRQFEVLAEVPFQPAETFHFEDREPPVGEAYYRIQTVDINGNQYASGIIRIQRALSGFELMTVMPVPFSDFLSFEFQLAESSPVNLELTDMTGRIIYRTSESFPAGVQVWEVNPGNIPAGIYILRFQQGRTTITRKVIKQ